MPFWLKPCSDIHTKKLVSIYSYSSAVFRVQRKRTNCDKNMNGDCWILTMKQPRNRETATLSIPVLPSQPYYPHSLVLCGIVHNQN